MPAHLAIVHTAGDRRKPEVAKNPGRKTDRDYGREDGKFLTEAQVMALVKAAEASRYGLRDSTMILLAYYHGLRVGELTGLTWQQVDFPERELHVIREKSGRNKRQTIRPDLYRRLKRLHDDREKGAEFVFMNERGKKLSTDAFASQLRTAAMRAGFTGNLLQLAHPHALRHACGAEMAKRGVEGYEIASYMGHRNLETTAQYYLDGVSGQDAWSKGRK